jgi:chaperonin cofactor prefoldin
MGIFSNTIKQIKPDDYITLSNRITEIASSIKILETQVETLKTNINSMNGRINRKLGGADQEQDLNKTFPLLGGGGLG